MPKKIKFMTMQDYEDMKENIVNKILPKVPVRNLKMSKKPKETGFIFLEDENCHWYLLPAHLEKEFCKLLSEDKFDKKFGKYQCTHPSRYLIKSFEELKDASLP